MNKHLLLYLILILAFSVRIVGLDFGLPFTYHDDEPIIVNYALSYGAGNFNPHMFNLPPLLSYLLFFEYGIFYLIGLLLGLFKNINDFAYLFLNNPTPFYLIGRFTCGVLPGTLSVFFIYLLGRKIFNNSVGLISAFFLALNFLHVRDSHYIYFDILLCAFLILLFIKSVDLMRTNSMRDYILVGVLIALVTSIKYFGPLLSPFLAVILVHNLINYRSQHFSNIRKIILLVLTCVVTFFILNPFTLLQFGRFLKMFPRMPFGPHSPFFHLKISLLGSTGLLMVFFGLMGMIAAAIRKNKAGMVLAFFVIYYYVIIIFKSQAAERYVMPIVPLLLMFAAYFTYTLSERIKRPLLKNIVFVPMVSLLILPGAHKAFFSDRLFLKTDTRTQAYDWIKQNVPAGSIVALDAVSSWYPRLEKSKEQIRKIYEDSRSMTFGKPEGSLDFKKKLMLSNPDYPKDTYTVYYIRGTKIRGFHSVYPDVNFDLDELIEREVEYVAVSTMYGNPRYGDFLDKLKKHARLLKTFSPYRSGIIRPWPEEDTVLPFGAFSFTELKDRVSFGPHIEIYKIVYE